MKSADKCYSNWEGAEAWGTADGNGRKPVSHKLYADLSQGKIYGYRQVGIRLERFEFSGIDPTLPAKVDELEDYVSTLDRIQTALLDSKGEARGLAPLNEQRKVPDEFIPSRFASAVQFGGVFGEGVPGSLHYTILPASVPVSSAEYPVRYFAKDNLFAIEVDGKYYCNWENAAEFGDVRPGGGVTPVRDKLYYCFGGVYAYLGGSWFVKIANLGEVSGSDCDCGERLDELRGLIGGVEGKADANAAAIETLRSGLENLDGGKVDEVLEVISGSGVMSGQEARRMVADIWGGSVTEPSGECLPVDEAVGIVNDIFGTAAAADGGGYLPDSEAAGIVGDIFD